METYRENYKVENVKAVDVMKEGWKMIKDSYWLFFGITFVALLIGGAIPIVLVGPMICGIYYCMLKRHDRGGTVDFGDFTKGFEFFGPSTIAILIMLAIIFPLALIVIGIPSLLIMFATAAGSPEAGLFFMVVMMIAMFIFGVFAACAHVLVMFTHLLIVDRKLDGWQAIKVSAKAGRQNVNLIVFFILVQFGLVLVGYMLCVVGAYLTLPIIYAGTTVMYRKIFPMLPGTMYDGVQAGANFTPNYPPGGFAQ